MIAIKARERRVDDHRQRAAARPPERPQKCDREHLLFSSRQLLFRHGVTVAIKERYFKGFRINANLMNEIVFSTDRPEALRHLSLKLMELQLRDGDEILLEGPLATV